MAIVQGTRPPLNLKKKYIYIYIYIYGLTGAIGVATDYHQMVKTLSFAFSGGVSRSVRSLSNTEQDSQHTRHKEEAEGRIKTDQACAKHLMFALTHWSMPLTQMVHS